MKNCSWERSWEWFQLVKYEFCVNLSRKALRSVSRLLLSTTFIFWNLSHIPSHQYLHKLEKQWEKERRNSCTYENQAQQLLHCVGGQETTNKTQTWKKRKKFQSFGCISVHNLGLNVTLTSPSLLLLCITSHTFNSLALLRDSLVSFLSRRSVLRSWCLMMSFTEIQLFYDLKGVSRSPIPLRRLLTTFFRHSKLQCIIVDDIMTRSSSRGYQQTLSNFISTVC